MSNNNFHAAFPFFTTHSSPPCSPSPVFGHYANDTYLKFLLVQKTGFCFSVWLLDTLNCCTVSSLWLFVQRLYLLQRIELVTECDRDAKASPTNAPKISWLKTTTIVFVHDSLDQDFEQSLAGQCLCSTQCWVNLSHAFTGIRAGQKGFVHSTTMLFHVDCFSLCGYSGLLHSYLRYPDFLYGISFPKEIITNSKGRHCSPKAQLLKLHTITYVAFCWTKQLKGSAQMSAEAK